MLVGIKRTTKIAAIMASKSAMASKDKNIQRGEQKYAPHNLTNTYL
jgi:hypothetical protein